MANILVRNVPDDIHEALADRAARARQSLQQYLLGQFERLAEHRNIDEILDEIETLEGGTVGFEVAVADLAAERAARP